MVACGTMNSFLGQTLEVYKAILLASSIRVAKHMHLVHACKAPEYIVYPRGQDPDSGQRNKAALTQMIRVLKQITWERRKLEWKGVKRREPSMKNRKRQN